MKLVIMEHPTAVPFNATWSCFQPHRDDMDPVWEMMGHKVVEVTEEVGERWLNQMSESLKLQVELQHIFNKK